MREFFKKKQVLTIPNLLSMVRLALIPLMVWLYCVKHEYVWAGTVLIFSGLTDIVDGFIARHFNMISDLGKMLDPLADKLTQLAMLLCLIIRFPLIIIPLILMVLKETFMTISGYLIIKKCDKVLGAVWHGKLATCFIHGMIMLHVFWFNIPNWASDMAIFACSSMIVLSFLLYALKNIKELRAVEKLSKETAEKK